MESGKRKKSIITEKAQRLIKMYRNIIFNHIKSTCDRYGLFKLWFNWSKLFKLMVLLTLRYVFVISCWQKVKNIKITCFKIAWYHFYSLVNKNASEWVIWYKTKNKKRVNKNDIELLTFYNLFSTQFRVDATTYKHKKDSLTI